MTFRCWDPDSGRTRDDAVTVEATDEREAAERYAERRFGEGDPFSEMDVRVAALGSSSVFDVAVTVEPVPVFCGGRPRLALTAAEKITVTAPRAPTSPANTR